MTNVLQQIWQLGVLVHMLLLLLLHTNLLFTQPPLTHSALDHIKMWSDKIILD